MVTIIALSITIKLALAYVLSCCMETVIRDEQQPHIDSRFDERWIGGSISGSSSHGGVI